MAGVAALRNPIPHPIDNILNDLIPGFPQSLSNIINEYVIGKLEFFGGEEWRKYFGVDIGDPKLPAEFFSWWYGQDAIDLFENQPNPRNNFETHIAVYRPKFINGEAYNLNMLFKLSTGKIKRKKPVTTEDHAVLAQCAEIPAGSEGWLVRRKGVVAIGLAYPDQKKYIDSINKQMDAQYECETDLIDLVTVVVQQRILQKELCMQESRESSLIYARCKNVVFVKLYAKYCSSIVRDLSTSGLDISADYLNGLGEKGPFYGEYIQNSDEAIRKKNTFAIALLRKFKES